MTEHILKEIEEAFFDIPFENSDFQNEHFILVAQHTPARAYRALGLRMHSKLQAINELKYARQLEEVDLDEKQSIIDNPSSNEFERRRAKIEIDKIKSTHNYTDKLLNDAIHDLNFMYAWFKKFPRYTRESFEGEERLHFEQDLRFQIETQGNGALQSLSFTNQENTSMFNNLLEEAKLNLLELNK
jgi:hypothetical protein